MCRRRRISNLRSRPRSGAWWNGSGPHDVALASPAPPYASRAAAGMRLLSGSSTSRGYLEHRQPAPRLPGSANSRRPISLLGDGLRPSARTSRVRVPLQAAEPRLLDLPGGAPGARSGAAIRSKRRAAPGEVANSLSRPASVASLIASSRAWGSSSGRSTSATCPRHDPLASYPHLLDVAHRRTEDDFLVRIMDIRERRTALRK